MDKVLREYEVSSRADGNALVNALQLAGYGVKAMLIARKSGAPLPHSSFYQVWSDGTVTWDCVPLDMGEVKGADYSLVQWTEGDVIGQMVIA